MRPGVNPETSVLNQLTPCTNPEYGRIQDRFTCLSALRLTSRRKRHCGAVFFWGYAISHTAVPYFSGGGTPLTPLSHSTRCLVWCGHTDESYCKPTREIPWISPEIKPTAVQDTTWLLTVTCSCTQMEACWVKHFVPRTKKPESQTFRHFLTIHKAPAVNTVTPPCKYRESRGH